MGPTKSRGKPHNIFWYLYQRRNQNSFKYERLSILGKWLTIIAKRFILDVWQRSDYAYCTLMQRHELM